ncbi:uroporphyrinogen-III C-methyltransferase [Gloeocapsa sp. PCC 73106]|uniref:uroporphyrinogen-III C-methyltransferase n=1 Tax=Gloeocapsa sp. PCC 73106 TaxID=102232 RepID=UPI0002ABF289|nr:uroporphyrinogen-III C-methyltransferase [Gloeocapsa sp. PCC 73106]ELR96333.1 uroporphyrin-III C-methyltransferase [Gloeocapsa sp. PCC 73106]
MGKVYLVGAGPGKIELITLRALALLKTAEVLVYDALIDAQLLTLVPCECLKIEAGKRGGKESTPQTTINQLLVAYCHQGKRVVRLKSGDPLIFGRSGSEISALIEENCQFEVIPGISSALAAPLFAGIPLTDPLLSSCFVVVTGHQPEDLDWCTLAKIDTIVILMGGSTLELIVEKLIAQGRSPTEPVAIIRACATKEQEFWQGTLADIVEKTRNRSLSPAVIVIGQVIQARFMSQPLPLTGKTILVTRAMEQSSEFANLLETQGAKVVEMPALVITPPSDWTALDQAIANLVGFDWLILTSANAVEYFFSRLSELNLDARALCQLKIAVVGQKTAASLAKYHLKPDFCPPNFVADSLVAHFPETLTNQSILFPRVETGGREVLVQELSEKGAKVTEVAAYQSGCPSEIDAIAQYALLNREVDLVTFASSKTVQNFHRLVTQITENNILEGVAIASIGPQTSKTCQELWGRVDIEAQEYTLEGLTRAICAYYGFPK